MVVPTLDVSPSSAERCRRATWRAAILVAAMRAEPAARQPVVTSAGATCAARALRRRSILGAAHRRVISVIVDLRALARHVLQATSAVAPAEAEDAAAEVEAGGAVADDDRLAYA